MVVKKIYLPNACKNILGVKWNKNILVVK